MAELKTRPNAASVADFIAAVPDQARRRDCEKVAALMEEVTGSPPVMWGPGIVGFGRYRYRYESGREGEWMLTGFSPRKKDLTLYVMAGFDAFSDLMKRLGKFKTGKSCLYLKRLDDVDAGVLRELLQRSVASMSDQRVDQPAREG